MYLDVELVKIQELELKSLSSYHSTLSLLSSFILHYTVLSDSLQSCPIMSYPFLDSSVPLLLPPLLLPLPFAHSLSIPSIILTILLHLPSTSLLFCLLPGLHSLAILLLFFPTSLPHFFPRHYFPFFPFLPLPTLPSLPTSTSSIRKNGRRRVIRPKL